MIIRQSEAGLATFTLRTTKEPETKNRLCLFLGVELLYFLKHMFIYIYFIIKKVILDKKKHFFQKKSSHTPKIKLYYNTNSL